MIIDIYKFLGDEKIFWQELELILDRRENDPYQRMDIKQLKRFHYLYQRTAADLAKIKSFSSEPEICRYLESLTARAYCEVHDTRKRPHKVSLWSWFFVTLPETFRRHIRIFAASLLVTLIGFAFGAMAVSFDPEAKEIILPFVHLQSNPSERIAQEEVADEDHLEGIKISGASWYMTHNTKVAITTMVMGITWGIGTIIMLFYNGAILGAVTLDYVIAKESTFLMAWLSPHGVIEIPAILIAGQAGLLLAGALIGWGRRVPLRTRLRLISGDLLTLIFGVALMLVWAGIIESFISQYHEPVMSYSTKIAFGAIELILLIIFFAKSGLKSSEGKHYNDKA